MNEIQNEVMNNRKMKRRVIVAVGKKDRRVIVDVGKKDRRVIVAVVSHYSTV